MEVKQIDAFEVKEHRAQQQVRITKELISMGLRAMAERGLRYLALLITAGLFAWAMVDPLGLRTINAGLFALVFLFVLNKNGGGDNGN